MPNGCPWSAKEQPLASADDSSAWGAGAAISEPSVCSMRHLCRWHLDAAVLSQCLSPTELGQFTNLRINFTQLPHIMHHNYRSPSSFYAVTEMQVLGSCFCNGHADHCIASRDPHAMVSLVM